MKAWVESWEHMPEEKFKNALETGVFTDYPGKTFLEFVLQKTDDNYAKIDLLEVERMNDASKNLENLEKEVELWTAVVERFPILKYDNRSELYREIQNFVLNYRTELAKQSKSLPDDFPLKSFEETDSRLLENN